MRAEYEFDYTKAARGKYYRQLIKEGSNVVVLDPDVAKTFRDSAKRCAPCSSFRKIHVNPNSDVRLDRVVMIRDS